jgi:hypothetical protein
MLDFKTEINEVVRCLVYYEGCCVVARLERQEAAHDVNNLRL